MSSFLFIFFFKNDKLKKENEKEEGKNTLQSVGSMLFFFFFFFLSTFLEEKNTISEQQQGAHTLPKSRVQIIIKKYYSCFISTPVESTGLFDAKSALIAASFKTGQSRTQCPDSLQREHLYSAGGVAGAR